LQYIFLVRPLLPSYDYKDGDKFRLWIPSMDSKTGIEQFNFIVS
jgi:hypothetical protein